MAPKPKLISAILKEIQDTPGRKEKIQKLQEFKSNGPLMAVLQAVFDERIVFQLPAGEPPYTVPEDMLDNTAGLYQEFRKFYIFTKNQRSANMKQMKREMAFIQMLESVHPDEAKLLISMKEKKMPYKGITKKLITDAYGQDFVK